jgi:hypothetical protein
MDPSIPSGSSRWLRRHARAAATVPLAGLGLIGLSVVAPQATAAPPVPDIVV